MCHGRHHCDGHQLDVVGGSHRWAGQGYVERQQLPTQLCDGNDPQHTGGRGRVQCPEWDLSGRVDHSRSGRVEHSQHDFDDRSADHFDDQWPGTGRGVTTGFWVGRGIATSSFDGRCNPYCILSPFDSQTSGTRSSEAPLSARLHRCRYRAGAESTAVTSPIGAVRHALDRDLSVGRDRYRSDDRRSCTSGLRSFVANACGLLEEALRARYCHPHGEHSQTRLPN